MKKITAILLAALFIFTLAAVSVSAADIGLSKGTVIVADKVLKATPTLDGNLDPAYATSLQVKISAPDCIYANYGPTDVKATVYALYDDNFVYVFYQVENDTTLQSADDEYIQDHYHPSLNDAVELRLGDDLAERLAPYDGSNDAHHLFIMDAYGKRFSCYEDSMGELVYEMDGVAKIVSATGYNVEIKIPVVEPFAEGDVIQFQFQVDDLQDPTLEKGTTSYIGMVNSPYHLHDFTIGGPAAGGTVAPPVVDTPVVDTPVVDTPVVDTPAVDTPVVDTPVVDAPVVDTPAVDTPADDEPAVDTPADDEPVEEPKEDEPVVDAPADDEPVEEPKEDEPKEDEPKAEEPKVEEPKVEEPKEEASNTGLIVAIVAAVVVIAAVVVVLLKEKEII